MSDETTPTPPLPHAAPAPAAAEAGGDGDAGHLRGMMAQARALTEARRLARLHQQRAEDEATSAGRLAVDLCSALERAEAAEAERDRLSAELAAMRGALDAWARELDGIEAMARGPGLQPHHLREMRDMSAALRAALATAPTLPAAEAGTGVEAVAWMLRWAPVVAAAEVQADEVGNLGPAYTRACTQTVLAVRAARVQEADHAR